MKDYYTIKKVEPKNNELRDIHEDMIGSRCYIVCLDTGKRAVLKCDMPYDPGKFHTVTTSIVESWWANDATGSVVTIETMNTVYVLEALKEKIK